MQYKLSPITDFSSCGADPRIRLRSYARTHTPKTVGANGLNCWECAFS